MPHALFLAKLALFQVFIDSLYERRQVSMPQVAANAPFALSRTPDGPAFFRFTPSKRHLSSRNCCDLEFDPSHQHIDRTTSIALVLPEKVRVLSYWLTRVE